MKKTLITVLLVSMSQLVLAKSVYEANNGDTISANISITDLTRISIEGQKIASNYSSADISKKTTKPQGDVYLIPNQKNTFTVFIVSDSGNTYSLKLTPTKNMHGDSIVIKPLELKNNKPKSSITFSSQSYIRNINYLMQTMYLDKTDDDLFNSTTNNQAIATYEGLQSALLKTYTNDDITGYVLLLKNISKSKITLSEAQFYSDNTLGVAIDNPELQVNDFTRVFIVKEGSK